MDDLTAPTRVNYRSGQLLDAGDLTDEQEYHRARHQRLSRLAVGSGVLCGLEVNATGAGQVVVGPGVAIDPLGREIVLTASHLVTDPFLPTDADGVPTGVPAVEGPVTLYLSYAERGGRPVPPGIDAVASDDDAFDRTIETYRIVVREGEPQLDPGLSAAQSEVILPAAPRRGFDRRVALYDALDRSCRAPAESLVVLASITPSKTGGAVVVDQGSRRRDLYSTAQLLDLVLALADRITAVEQAQASSRRQADR